MVGLSQTIENDMFDISARLKSIDCSYFIIRNYINNKFEIHSAAQRGNTLALVLPYESLDCRTVEYVLKTRAERKEELLKEMEEDNRKLSVLENCRAMKKAEKEVENVYSKI